MSPGLERDDIVFCRRQSFVVWRRTLCVIEATVLFLVVVTDSAVGSSVIDKQGPSTEFNFTKFVNPETGTQGELGWDESLIGGVYHCEKLSSADVAAWTAFYLGLGNTPEESAARASADIWFNFTLDGPHNWSINLTYNNLNEWENPGPYILGQTVAGSLSTFTYQFYSGLLYHNTILSQRIWFFSPPLWVYTLLTFDKTHVFEVVKVRDSANVRNCTRISALPNPHTGY